MKHPRTRSERRHERERIIARRKFIDLHIWRFSWRPDDFNWGVYAKFNLGCGSTMCHAYKYFKFKRKRRRYRQQAESTADCRRGDQTLGW